MLHFLPQAVTSSLAPLGPAGKTNYYTLPYIHSTRNLIHSARFVCLFKNALSTASATKTFTAQLTNTHTVMILFRQSLGQTLELTSWYMVFLNKIVTQPVKNYLMFQKRKVHLQVHKGSSLDILGQLNPVYSITPNLSKVHIIPLSIPRPLKCWGL
jgi:hypothetical protein